MYRRLLSPVHAFAIIPCMLITGCNNDTNNDTRPYTTDPTPVPLAQSPLPLYDAEILALEAGNSISATKSIYDRIAADLQLIRSQNPALAAIQPLPSWNPSSILVEFDSQGIAAFTAGTYTDWDTLNMQFYLTGTSTYPAVAPNLVSLDFRPQLKTPLVVSKYKSLQHVLNAQPNEIGGDGPDICASIDGDTYSYIFKEATGDCTSGCDTMAFHGFSTTSCSATDVTSLGSFDDSTLPPAWFKALGKCTQWLFF